MQKVLRSTWQMFYVWIKPLGQAVPVFGDLSHELSEPSGLGGGVDPALGLIATYLGRLVKPPSFKFSSMTAIEQSATDRDVIGTFGIEANTEISHLHSHNE
ncbi:hypothetical protein PsAD13_01482 [Pseudovibrio sp. Ad13]|uniref:hypothetical protein n=1 Tax=unclassified Pseudovibrio TaxID=2627060 RepID=UPI0007B30094|nr:MULTISPECIES: hypothetical protein [unclassified Pseudovibrio]KZK84948.1 hypothetical protein PsAD13_01482 [Pseudovibrio sp. Ad13]